MRSKILIAIGIAIAIFATVYFVIKQNILLTVLSVVGMFIFTNMLRSIAFKERGLVREAKWMRLLSIISGVLFVVVLMLVLFEF